MKNTLLDRTKSFAIAIILMTEKLPKAYACSVASKQIVRSATSVGANYRASQRARSDREFIAKLQIVLEESDETLYWLEIIQDMNWLKEELLLPLITEANELTAMFVSSLKKVKDRIGKKA
jgi:four helix bundle protein